MDGADEDTVAHGGYLDRLMRRRSFEALWPLFSLATKPAKEMTESFSALVHLRPHLPPEGPFRVLHVGDGAHARTAGLFALKTRGENISVDPLIHEGHVGRWQAKYDIQRFAWRRARIEDVIDELLQLPRLPLFVTFVHAHVDVDAVLEPLPWRAAYTLACCCPARQLSRVHAPHAEGHDHGVLSPDRHYQVLVAPSS